MRVSTSVIQTQRNSLTNGLDFGSIILQKHFPTGILIEMLKEKSYGVFVTKVSHQYSDQNSIRIPLSSEFFKNSDDIFSTFPTGKNKWLLNSSKPFPTGILIKK